MLSNERIQECIDDIGGIMQTQLWVYDNDGTVVAGTAPADVAAGEWLDAFLEMSLEYQKIEEGYFYRLDDGDDTVYVVMAKDTAGQQVCEDHAERAGRLAVRQLMRLMDAYKEKFSRNQFIQNLLLDNLVGADIFNQSKLFGIEAGVPRTVFVIETEQEPEAVLEMIRELYGKNSYDFVTAVDDKCIILVKELREEDAKEENLSVANMLVDMINVETLLKVRVGYSNPAADIREVSRAYREAKLAVEVGKIFYSDKTIVAYNMLGIGRLIYQLPPELCDMFLDEVFNGVVPEKFDDEMLATINKFFELNLNLSETSRQMYIHRNTLAYRLERIQKMTGLDIRFFEDAMTFKLALMVADYRRMTKK